MQTVKTLQISFSLPITASEIRQWRGAFIQMAGWQDDVFHNHANETRTDENGNNKVVKTHQKYHYRYPMVQYRVHRGKAAVFATGQGLEALQKVLAQADWNLNWQGEKRTLYIEDIKMYQCVPAMLTAPKLYKIYRYMPFNDKNYDRWKNCAGLRERIDLLEHLLTQHIVAYCKSLEWFPEERVVVTLQDMVKTRTVPYHEAKLKAFDLQFTTNILLPDFIGIGKGVSQGYGEMSEWKERKVRQQKEVGVLSKQG